MDGECSTYGGDEPYISVGKPKRKRQLGRPRHRWEDNIQMDIKEIVCDVGDWIRVAQDRVQLWRPYGHGN
jgi:hypothetical protein